MSIDLPDEAKTAIVETATKTTKNLTDKPSKAIGEGLTDVIEIVFSVFKLWNGKIQAKIDSSIENYKKEIEEKSNSIPEDKLTEPNVQVITTAIENSKYCVTEDELREMFVNLIGSACNSDTKDDVHPAFSAIIKELSPQDAKVLKGLKEFAENRRFSFDHILDKFNCEHDFYSPKVERINMSVDNLVRLGLLCKNYRTNWYVQNIVKNIIETAGSPEDMKERLQQKARTEKLLDKYFLPEDMENLKYGVVYSYSFTPMGKHFIEVCC
jgi:hypothetical protein